MGRVQRSMLKLKGGCKPSWHHSFRDGNVVDVCSGPSRWVEARRRECGARLLTHGRRNVRTLQLHAGLLLQRYDL